jgi:outer membrane protein OmpA-like peptidoglycan-associated protein
MKTRKLILALGLITTASVYAQTQNESPKGVLVDITEVTISEVDCKPLYSTSWNENWYIQLGAGGNMPLVENYLPKQSADRQITLAMNVAVGRWFSPYMGFRFSALGGALHWENVDYSKARYANLNVDFMWDMMNSVAGVNPSRVFSINPFVGLGGAYTWDIDSKASNVYADGKIRTDTWTMPVSAGIQFRFRTSKYVDIFVEARSQFYADVFNGYAGGKPIDIDLTAIGGLSYNIGGVTFAKTDPCAYIGYMHNMNDEINGLRAKLSKTKSDLDAANAKLPCPDPVEQITVVEVDSPMPLATVRFALNSSKITSEQMVNVYNIAQWLEANPMASITICGYADNETGSADYNMKLSEQRAQTVYDTLVNDYGVDASRLSMVAFGSETQPYDTNNWNRIVIFQNN